MRFLPSIVNAEYRGDFRIQVTFNDGTDEVLDFGQWLVGPIFEPLKHREYFRHFFVEGGAITWPNGADIAPETLYDAALGKRKRKQGTQSGNSQLPSALTRRGARKTSTRHKSKRALARKAESNFQNLTKGGQDFWTIVQAMSGDTSHEDLLALVDLGLRRTKGSYPKLAELFHVSKNEYRRLMDFLRRNECLLDFRSYRKTT